MKYIHTFRFVTIAMLISSFCISAQSQIKTLIPNEIHLMQNPFNPMNILLVPSAIDGITPKSGDLILAFDNEVCVGASVIDDINVLLNLVATSTDEVNKGFKSGKVIRLEYHSTYDNTVYELVPKKILMGSMNYEELGTLYAEFKAQILSTDQNNVIGNIRVFPNPVAQQLHIVLENENISQGESFNIKLIDINGKTVRQREVNKNQNVINLEVGNLPSGEYVLSLVSSKIQFTQKVIKK